LLEELEQTGFIAALVGINLRVMTFEIAVGESGRGTVAGAGNVNYIQIILSDQPVQVNPNQGLTGIRSPMAQKPVLDVFRFQRFAQEGIRAKINHACRKIIAGSPIRMHLAQFFGRKGCYFSFACH
jgi:hypothetical protein